MTNMQDQLNSLKAAAQHDRPTNTFIRKGIIGDHKNLMTKETIKRFGVWMDEIKNIKSPF